MLSCKDPAMTALRDKGWNVVLMPKSDLVPGELLVAKGSRLQRLGNLDTVFPPTGAALPKLSFNNKAPDLSGGKTQSMKLSIGLDILKGLIGTLGGSTLGINAAYSKAKSVQFEYTDITVDTAEMAGIDIYLSNTAAVNGKAVRAMLAADKVFVITSVVKARKLSVDAKSENGASLGVDLPVVQNAVGANIKVESKGEANSKLLYTSDIPLAFGFQATKLDFEGSDYKTLKLVKAGDVALESAREKYRNDRSVAFR